MTPTSHTFRIFISSTFSDLVAERVFPQPGCHVTLE